MKRRLLLTVVLSLSTLATGVFAAAAGYPAKPVTIIAPSGPGGGFDFVGRLMAESLTKQFGSTFVVENRAGSGTLIGTQAAATAAPDGYTLLVGGLSNMVFNAALYKTLPYDPKSDFVPVALVARYPYVLVARGDLPQDNYKDLLEALRANPDKLTIATVGPGSGQQVLAATFAKSTNTRLLPIPYKSAQAAYQDLLAGRVDLFIDTLPSARVHLESKRAKAIFVTSQRRNATLANVPTAGELGLPALEMGSWFGLFAQRTTPAPVVAELRLKLAASMQNADLRKRLEQSGIEVMDFKPADTDAFIRSEYDKWTTVIKQAGITTE